VRVNAAFNNFNLPWLVGLAGLIFAPWTALMYVIVFPLNGWDWLWIGLAIGCDIASLYKEKEQLTSHISTINYSDQDIAIIDEFCKKLRNNLEQVTFEGKRRILELLDVHGTLVIENDEKVLYITCAIYPQPVSRARTSPLSNTGEIAIHLYTSQPTTLSR
jgi:hypothetical protein